MRGDRQGAERPFCPGIFSFMNLISRRTRIQSVNALPWVAMIAMAAMWPRRPAENEPSLSEPPKNAPHEFDADQPGR